MEVVLGRSDGLLIDYDRLSIVDFQYRFSIFSHFNEIGVELYIIGPSEFNGGRFRAIRSMVDRLSIVAFQYFRISTRLVSI